MTKISIGHVVAGVLLSLAGGGAAVAGAMRLTWIPSLILYVDGPVFVLVVGSVLVLGGLILFACSPRRDLGPEPTILAHVAFSAKPPAQPGAVEPPRPAVRAPKSLAVKAKLAPDVLRIDDEIKEVTREINKAGVALATGRLSREGYTQYVDELKRRRGELEAARMGIEIRHHGN